MASIRDIRRRKESIESTQQITNAMKLVATVKLQRAGARAEKARAYFHKMYETVQSVLASSEQMDHPFLTSGGSKRKAVIVVTSNRGLAGGYNSNVVRLILERSWDKEDLDLYSVGRKGADLLARKGYSVVSGDTDMMDEPTFAAAADLGEKVLDAFLAGQVGEIWLAYTRFKNTVAHVPTLIRLLPVEAEQNGTAREDRGKLLMNYEPGEEEVLDLLIPQYVSSMIYGALIEASASENAARMQAMDSATGNAGEMIEELSLIYNRVRQGAITQELTEIISGAEALNNG